MPASNMPHLWAGVELLNMTSFNKIIFPMNVYITNDYSHLTCCFRSFMYVAKDCKKMNNMNSYVMNNVCNFKF